MKLRQVYDPDAIAEKAFLASGKESEAIGAGITARSLQDLTRLATALARMEMSHEVTVKHAEIAVQLMAASIRSLNEAIGQEDVMDAGVLHGKSSIRESNPWRNAKDYKESARIIKFLRHFFVEQRNDPLKQTDLKEVLITEVVMHSKNMTVDKADSRADRHIEQLIQRGKLIDRDGNGRYVYRK